MAVQVHAEEVDFILFKEACGRLKEEMVLSKDLEEFHYDLLM